eukprot:TRINITY_DN76501_c0_g1_i1.p1 TRINITY_DN76501_c0_g1~~TRINITY_DN76501_c0_g1_i1.p1  ORF type:complete len:288 (+),score=47.52 TRINITY_DN76501_c0_g1_i1:60-923(+)
MVLSVMLRPPRPSDTRQGLMLRLASAAALLECGCFRQASANILLSELPDRPESKDHYCPFSSCPDPVLGKSKCYEPVCPMGYYKCCATCTDAPCYGAQDMLLSWRGVEECLRCPAGYFCEGCDTFEPCPLSTRPGREGPRSSPAGSSRLSECEACSSVHEASLDLSQCVPRFTTLPDGTEACSREYVTRCVRNCESPDPSRRKQLTPCEKMKCEIKCAKLWSPKCLESLKPICEMTTKERQVDLSLKVTDDEVPFIEDCDVDCNSASRAASALSLLVALLGSAWHRS